jgi:4-amino-4-deoxy-L-arabinose transferase-like glycosyltransferase
MMSSLAIQDPPATAPRRVLGNARRASQLLSRTDVRLALVLVLAFVPRAIAAWRLTAVSDDAYYYLHVADSLQRGNIARGLEYLNINVYPVVLIVLHRLGLDWIVAGKLWGILMGSALVLPLFDWLRRMFNERIAMLAVLLYAVHPKIIEMTVEPLREATFWFFFVLCLDLFWRAAQERRWWQFVAAGTSLALALHTRIEAWFLLAPFGVWFAVSWWRAPEARKRLLGGSLLCLAITPLFVFLVNVTLLANHSQWELGRLSPFLLLGKFVQAPAHDAAEPATTVPVPAASSVAHVEGSATVSEGGPSPAVQQYFRELTRTLGPVFLVLTLIGFVRDRREFLDPNKAVLGLLTLAVLLAIWIRVSELGNMNGRYFLILVFIDAPFTALGTLVLIRRIEQFRFDRRIDWLQPGRVSAVVVSVLLLAGFVQAVSNHHRNRDNEARLGKWIARQAGAFHSVIADFTSIRPAYIAARSMPDVVTFDEFYQKRFDRFPPDLAIFHPASFREGLLPHLVRRMARLGLTPLDLDGFSHAKPEYAVFVRNRQ